MFGDQVSREFHRDRLERRPAGKIVPIAIRFQRERIGRESRADTVRADVSLVSTLSSKFMRAVYERSNETLSPTAQ